MSAVSLHRPAVSAMITAALFVITSELSAAEAPNVVMIMTDNHGAWTLGCYGNNDIRTPNIDRLAEEGTLFDNAFASNPVCSPTRATVLTGLIPSQHGVHCFLRGGNLQVGPKARCTLDEFRSLPEILKDAGYRCGLVGKWHLGANLSPQEGLDDYWITMPHGGTSTFYDAQIIEDGKIRKEPQYLTDFWTKHAVHFISQQSKEQPFFLFLSYNGPYSLSRLLLREGRNRHADYYRDKELPSFPREKTHPWQLHNRDYINNPTSIRRVATEVSGVDDGVGSIMSTLKQHGMDENTIVIFLADQGWVGGHGGFFGMGDHTRPVTARDGMMKIPMIWRFPNRIAADRRSDRMVANYDVLPTLLDQLNLRDETPEMSPGRSFLKELDPKKTASSPFVRSVQTHAAVFYEFESLRCIRTGSWKYVHRHPNGPHELYNLHDDPDEFHNLCGDRTLEADSRLAGVQQELKQRLDEFFSQYAAPKYDLWNGGGSQTFIYDGIEEELAQREPTPPPPQPDDFSQQTFTLPEGFTAELAAGPPLVTHPTMGCFDDKGRLYVCNNAGVNMSAAELEESRPNSINMLEDRDGDGVFDKSTVFADRMTFPMGGAWHDGALYVASPPSIWRLEDTDGDGVADKRDVIVDKFGYTGNAASIHGCFLSPDGRLYWCDGYHGHEFRDEAGNVVSKRKGSYIFSSRVDGSDVRIHCGGGMDNPVEVDFTDEGDVIGTVNILYTRPRVDCLVHWQYGGAYPHREAVLDELKVTGPLLEPMHRFGHVAVSGTTRYRSGVLNHNWRDSFFSTFFNLGKVVRVELSRSGSSYAATQREFLSCSNRDFHPTDVIEDADGSLLVVDTGGWFYRGCPTSQIARPDILGGIYRIRRDGMTTQVDPRGLRTDWASRSVTQLMRDLKETRIAVRQKAIDECVRRGQDAVPRLAATVRSGDLPARRSALFALTRIIGNPADQDVILSAAATARRAIRDALQDRHDGIRQIACHAITVNPDPLAVPVLIELLHDPSDAVRRKAAEALGRIGDETAIPSLIDLLRCEDRNLSHAASYGLIEIGNPEFIRLERLKGADPATIIRANMAALQIDSEASEPSERRGAPVCDWPEDSRLQREMLTYYSDYVRHIRNGKRHYDDILFREMLAVFDGLVQRHQQGTADGTLLADFVAEFSDIERVAERAGQLLSDESTQGKLRSSLLSGMTRTSATVHDSWLAPVIAELESGVFERVHAALKSAAQFSDDAIRPPVERLAQESSRPDTQLAAIECLLAWNRRPSPQVFAALYEHAAGGAPSVSATAVRLLSTTTLNQDQLLKTAGLLPSAGPQQLRDLVSLFRNTRDAGIATAVVESLEDARSFGSLRLTELSEVVKRFPQELHGRSNRLLDSLREKEQMKLQKLDTVAGLLSQASAERGREAFFAEKSKCATCHVVGDRGKRVGPDLTTIGASRSAKDLLESIIFPSSTIVRQYEPYTVVTTAGRTHSGLIARDTVDSVTIQQTTGDPITIRRDDIEEIVPGTVSIMPRGLDEALTPQQTADLVRWLQSLR